MDLIDYNLLACLKENARENATNIGAKINLSTSAVIERIRKLEKLGVIEGYTTIINQAALGRDITAFIYVSLEHPKYNQEFIRLINENNSLQNVTMLPAISILFLRLLLKREAILKKY